MHTDRVTTLVAILAMAILVGCDTSDPATRLHPVTGQVKFDGVPIPEGRVLFRAGAGDKGGFSGEIYNGSYELKAVAGKMTVEVTASRMIPGKFDESNPGERHSVGEMYIPARYNTATELTAEVQAGRNKVDFDLTGDAKAGEPKQ